MRALWLCLFCGCATLTGEQSQSLSVASNPAGARVWVDGAYAGQTPMVLQLPRQRESQVELALDGYQSQLCPTTQSANSGYVVADALLCLLLFPIGCVSFIDAGGAWSSLDYPVCNAELEPAPAAPSGGL